MTALDLAEVLVGRGVPFRTAHESVGSLIRALAADGRTMTDATAEDLLAADARFAAEDLARLDPRQSVMHRVTPGGGSYDEVVRQIKRLRGLLADL